MRIPNYDKKDKKNKVFKQLYKFMPSNTFRMLICGPSGSGKTNTLFHMLREPYDLHHICFQMRDFLGKITKRDFSEKRDDYSLTKMIKNNI